MHMIEQVVNVSIPCVHIQIHSLPRSLHTQKNSRYNIINIINIKNIGTLVDDLPNFRTCMSCCCMQRAHFMFKMLIDQSKTYYLSKKTNFTVIPYIYTR